MDADKKTEQVNALGRAVYNADDKAKLDTTVKKLLSHKSILAYLLKYAVEEFESYTIAEIVPMIEDVRIGTVPVEPGETNDVITGMPQEGKIPGEGSLTYDVRFFVRLPGEENRAEYTLLIDVEAQGEPHQTYWIETRGIVYGSRMISEQVGRNITHGHYEKAQKVYSIWICMNCPQEYANTISEYGITKRKEVGDIDIDPRIDLMSVTVIRLPKDNEWDKAKNPANRLTEMLSTLLSEQIPPKDKLDTLSKKFDIPVTEKLEGEVNEMCNYSDYIEKKAREKDDLTHIQNLMQTTGWSADEAMNALKVDPDKRDSYKDIISGKKPVMA